MKLEIDPNQQDLLEVPFWNIELGRHTKATSGVHRAGCGNSFKCSAKQTRCFGEYRDYESVCPDAANVGNQCHPGAQAQ